MFAKGSDPSESVEILNRDLENFLFGQLNGMYNLILLKQNIYFFKTKFSIFFNNIYIERVDVHKHLGLYLSSSLDWSKQIDEICMANIK